MIRASSLPTLALGLAVVASVPMIAPAAPAKSKSASPPFVTRTLRNGLTLLLSPSKSHPVVALSAFVTTGGRTEDEHYQGSLHYIEHLVYKGGTPNLPPTEFRKKLSTLGREAGGWTWDDEINFGFESPKESFDEALAVFHEALHDLKFEEQWFEDEKRVVLQEMQQGLEEPGSMIYEAWDELAFDIHPYGRSVIGTEQAILGLEMRATEKYYRDRFTPNHMIVSVTGDFEIEDMVGRLDRTWGGDAKGPESFELGFVEPPMRGPRRRVEHLPQATSAMLLTGVVTTGGADADTPALLFLAELLNHPSYGLPQFLEQQAIWVSSVGASHYSMRDFGTFRVFARMDPEKEVAVEEFVASFLLEFDATALPKDAFETTRRLLLGREARARETAAKRAERLGFLASRHGTEGAATLLARIEKLTPADVQSVKEEWVQPRRFVTVTVFPDSFDVANSLAESVQPKLPAPPALPDLDTAGALRAPRGAKPLAYETAPALDGVTKLTFANGLRVLVRPTDASELVAISGRMIGGQWVESTGEDGMNRFVAELGLSSTRRWNDEAFRLLLGSLGATASAHISVGSRANTSRNVDYRDSAAHHYTGLSSQWRELLACLKESLFFTSPDSAEVERVRMSLLTEIGAIEEDQLELLKQEFYVRAYAGHPYGKPTVGTDATIRAITSANLASFHAAHWTPDRCVVSIVGNVKPAAVAEWIAACWADLPDRGAGFPKGETDSWSFTASGLDQTLERGKDYWTVNWGKPGAAYDDPSWAASVVLSQVAGNDHFYKYVYGEGVSYRSWIRFWPNLRTGTWIVENDVKRERFDEILGKFDEDLERYSASGFTEKEFADAVQRLANSEILDAQSNSMLAWKLAVAEGNGAGFTRATRLPETVRDVPYAEVQDLAREVFPPKTMLKLRQK